MSKYRISVIVPAYNEELEIATTINSIFIAMRGLNTETIVVDNHSTDRTKEICKELDVVTITSSAKTIAGVRNEGATLANGEFLVFVDADISLDKDWGEVFSDIINSSNYPANFIFGSRCKTPYLDYVSRGWFSKLNNKKSDYINSGHLIIPKSVFEKIGGFTSHLSTSEDVDICQKAVSKNISVIHTPELKAFHRGFPRTLLDLTRREIWHGYQDSSSLSSFLLSQTALFSVIVTLISTGALLASIWFVMPIIAIFAAAFFFIASYTFYCYKTRFGVDSLIFWPIASCYIIGRTLSIINHILSKSNSSPRAVKKSNK